MADRLEMLRQMQAENPTDPFFAYAIALETGKNDAAEGIAKLKDLALNCPDYLPTYYQLATWLYEVEKEQEALAYLRTGASVAMAQGEAKTLREINALMAELSS